ncbi:hypothetical protein DEO48_03540 [Enterobacter sp. CGMCC 5087]|nr:hypothetical protein DEO48_03540 [Enterobacter sp. CGMCC 5087]
MTVLVFKLGRIWKSRSGGAPPRSQTCVAKEYMTRTKDRRHQMSVQKKVCLSDSPTKEGRSCTLFFVFQALKPFTRD